MAGELTEKDKIEWERLSAPMQWPATWPAWVVESFTKFKWIPVASRFWVSKLCSFIIAESFPLIKQADSKVSGSRVLGRAVGQQLECLQVLEESWKKAEQTLAEIDARLQQRISPKTYARLQKKGQKYQADLEKLVQDFTAVAEKKLELCNAIQVLAQQQPRAESAEFSIGLGEARANPFAGENGELIVGGYRLKLYLLLLVFWRFVEKFNSSIELYHWSCRWLGKNAVGDIFTFQRLCRSHSIRLGVRGKRVSKRPMRRRKRMH